MTDLQKIENRIFGFLAYVFCAFVTLLAIRAAMWLFGFGFVERLL